MNVLAAFLLSLTLTLTTQADGGDREAARGDQGSVRVKIDRYAPLVRRLHKMIAAKPRSARLYTVLGIVYRRAWMPAHAERAFLKALSFEPKHPDAQVGLASLALDRGKLKQARRRLDKVLKTRPKHAAAMAASGRFWQLKAASAQKKKRRVLLSRAVRDLEKAFKAAPLRHRYAFRLGLLRLAQGDYFRAHVHFVAAVGKAPRRPCYRLGLYIADGLLTNKKKTLGKILKWRRRCPDRTMHSLASRAILTVGMKLLPRKPGASGIAQMVRVLRGLRSQVPRAPEIPLLLAMLSVYCGDCVRAVLNAKQALRLAPGDSRVKALAQSKAITNCKKKKGAPPKIKTTKPSSK